MPIIGYQHPMNVSAFDLFKLGIGPSSSHTMGPMTAAWFFGRFLGVGRVETCAGSRSTLYASLALTGRGHATDRAVIPGAGRLQPRGLDLTGRGHREVARQPAG